MFGGVDKGRAILTVRRMKTVVFYYTQSGQALEAVKNICGVLLQNNKEKRINDEVVYKQIKPLEHYPFPWSHYEFFDTFPETRLGIPPSGIEPIDFSDIDDADIVIVSGQSWFLSPSLPLQSFFRDDQVRHYLQGRPIVFVNVCRNMWLMTSREIKRYVHNTKARLIGHIVLQDRTPNLISALTIVRWLIGGRKKAEGLLPDAGISDTDLQAASRFGDIIRNTWEEEKTKLLQQRLLEAGAIDYKPSILFLEKAGHRMFGLWAAFIRKKGGFRSPQRRLRVNIFYYYLLTVLFLVSPFGQLIFYLTWPLQHVRRHEHEDCNV